MHHCLAKARNSRWPSDCATCTLAANWPHQLFGHDVIGTLPWRRTRHTPELVTGSKKGGRREEKKKRKRKKERYQSTFCVTGYHKMLPLALLLIPPTIHLTLHLFPSPTTPHHTSHTPPTLSSYYIFRHPIFSFYPLQSKFSIFHCSFE